MRFQGQKYDLNAMSRICSNVHMNGGIMLPSYSIYKRLTEVREIVLNEETSNTLIYKLYLLPHRVSVEKKKIHQSAR